MQNKSWMINPRPAVELTREGNSTIIISSHPRSRSGMTSLKRSAKKYMEPTFRTATWTPGYYGQDQSFAKSITDVIFVEPGEKTDYSLSSSDGACAIRTIISSISHPDYGEIKGVFDEGLDLYIVREDGTVMIVNAEEEPGKIDDSEEVLSTAPFTLRLRNPEETGVTLAQYRGLFIQQTWKLMREFEEARIRKELKIPTAEQGVATNRLPADA